MNLQPREQIVHETGYGIDGDPSVTVTREFHEGGVTERTHRVVGYNGSDFEPIIQTETHERPLSWTDVM